MSPIGKSCPRFQLTPRSQCLKSNLIFNFINSFAERTVESNHIPISRVCLSRAGTRCNAEVLPPLVSTLLTLVGCCPSADNLREFSRCFPFKLPPDKAVRGENPWRARHSYTGVDFIAPR